MLVIPRGIYNRMIAQAREAGQHECCGLLAGKEGRVVCCYGIGNIAGPEEMCTAFVMDPHGMSIALKAMRDRGLVLLAIYHSHPRGPVWPSRRDEQEAQAYEETREMLALPEALHCVISGTGVAGAPVEVHMFRWVEGQMVLQLHEVEEEGACDEKA